MDKVSVIIPVYKVEPYLRRCVDSVLNQTYTNLEVILVDDGSPDNCGVICEEYAAKDKRVKVIHQENRGLSEARNAGLEAAKGEFISFVDSDDAVAPDFLQVLMDALITFDADVAQCSRVDVYDRRLPETQDGTFRMMCYEPEEAFSLLIPNQIISQTVWNKLYKKEAIGLLRFPRGKQHEDEFFTWQLLCRCGKVVTVDAKLYFYYHREGSIMESFSLKRMDFLEARLERHRYILEHFPHLTIESKKSILLPCIFLMQRLLKGKDKKMIVQCQKILCQSYDAARMSKKEKMQMNFVTRQWLRLADLSLLLCAEIRNLLGRPF